MRANPADLERARGYRAALLRLARSSPAEACPRLVELEGALCVSRSLAEEPAHLKRGLPRWERVAVGGRPVLLPRLPQRLTSRWSAPGQALWLGEGVVLLEGAGGRLDARCARSGALRWSVPSLRSELGELGEDERALALAWAVAPWGAVELVARYEAPFEFRRAGRYHAELGRVTEREVVGRTAAHVELALQLVLPVGGGWAPGGEPEVVVERTDGGPLCDSELHLQGWNDDLLELSLDTLSRQLAVSWRDEDEDWTVLRVGGDEVVPGHVAPAHWTSGAEDPFPPASEAPLEAPAPASLEPGSLLVPGDGASLVALGRDPARIQRFEWESGGLTPWPVDAPGGWSHTAVLRASDEVDLDPRGAAQVLLAAGQVFLQLGEGELQAYGDPE